MSFKGRSHPKFKHGMYVGYKEYRYGDSRKPVSLPRVFVGKERRHIIQDVMDVLQDWRTSPFQHEGPMRAGMRSSMCLQGHAWSIADAEAHAIVSAAFQEIGAARPTWEQGQKEYTVADGYCAWCLVQIPEDLANLKKPSRYCSAVCARAAIVHRDIQHSGETSAAYEAAINTIHRTKHPSRNCEKCSKLFRPTFATGKYCSQACAKEAQRYLTPRQCLTCEKIFQPSGSSVRFCSRRCGHISQNTRGFPNCQRCGVAFRAMRHGAKYCSTACYGADKGNARFDRTCTMCSTGFVSASAKSMYCSPTCSWRATQAKKIARAREQVVVPFVPVHMLTAQVIDGWFARAA